MIKFNQDMMIKLRLFVAVWIYIESGREARPRGLQGGLPVWFSGFLVESGGIFEECGHELDANFTHPQLCDGGRAKLRTRRSLCMALVRSRPKWTLRVLSQS